MNAFEIPLGDEQLPPYNSVYVDLPDPNNFGPEVQWVNIESFSSREEAIKWAMENLGADDQGRIQIVTGGISNDD